jgi:hypothetical protein
MAVEDGESRRNAVDNCIFLWITAAASCAACRARVCSEHADDLRRRRASDEKLAAQA